MKTILGMLTLIAAGFLTIGCDTEETAVYDLDVEWTIGGGADCMAYFQGDPVALDTVQIRVFESEEDALAETDAVDDVTSICSTNTYTLRRLSRGGYWLLVQASGDIGDETLPLYESLSEVGVPAEGDRVSVSLTQAPGTIAVQWGFDNSLTCAVNGVAQVQIDGYQSVVVPCEDGQYLFDDVVANMYSVQLVGLDEAGEPIDGMTVNSEDMFLVLPGQTYEETLIFPPQ